MYKIHDANTGRIINILSPQIKSSAQRQYKLTL